MSSLNVHSMYDRAKNIYADFLMHAIFYPGRWMVIIAFYPEDVSVKVILNILIADRGSIPREDWSRLPQSTGVN